MNGRNALSWDDKFRLDTWYVDHRGLMLDLKILALTVVKVLKREGIRAEGHATMPEFRASDEVSAAAEPEPEQQHGEEQRRVVEAGREEPEGEEDEGQRRSTEEKVLVADVS